MIKYRIQITVVNPGFEQTASALGALTIDFDDKDSFDQARRQVYLRSTESPRHPVFIENEKGEQISWEAKYYHSMWAGPYDEWAKPNWMLPEEGAAPGHSS